MIEITFSSSTKEASAFGLTQWDKGQKLKIIWSEMPESFQVHFASRNSQEAIVAEAKGQAGVAVVDIPDELLKNSADIFAWIYLTENESVGESVKRAVLYVRPRAKPHTLIDELEMTQQEILENILADINENIRNIKENGIDAEYLPEYIVKEAEKVLSRVEEYQTEDSLVFIASSDAHLKVGDYNSETSLRHLSQAMRLVCERYPMEFAAYLGDMTSGGSNKGIAEAKKEIMRVNSALFSPHHGLKSFVCPGSEDSLLKSYYRNDDYINNTELFNLIGRWNKDTDISDEQRARGYFYRDFDEVKVRVICLNTSDNYGKKLSAASETAIMSSPQLQWLCESLDLSAKENSNSWGIILLGHHPLNMINKFPLAVNILDAYTKGGAINVLSSDGTNIAYDFADKNSAKIYGQFHGHLHNYKVSFITDSNIPLICIPNASYYNNNFYASDIYSHTENDTYSESVTYDKTVNSAKDTAFCVVVIDKATGKINVVHYGAGVDRTIAGTTVSEDPGDDEETETEPDNGSDSGSEGGSGGDSGDEGGSDNEGESGDTLTYTNLVPSAKTKSGVIHNKKGYTDGYKLSSTGDVAYGPSYTFTGFMEAAYGDIIRVSGGTYDGTAGNYILVYDSSYNLIWITTLTGSDDEASGIKYIDSSVIKFTPALVQTGNLEQMAFIRVSTVGVGADLIVTRNEPIINEGDLDVIPPVVNYVNILKYATDAQGNTYGTDGYADGIMLSPTGEETAADGYVSSGFLVVYSDGVIRTKGLSFDGAQGSCINLYDSNYEFIRTIYLSTYDNASNGVTYADGIHTFTPATAVSDLSGMAYFRISGKGSGSDFIITYCEEID